MSTRRIGLGGSTGNPALQPIQQEEMYQAPPAGSTLSGQLPLATAPIVSPKSLTPQERRVLEAAGWHAGDPLPADLAANPAVQAMMAEIAAEDEARTLKPPPGFTEASIPEPIPVPPSRRAEVNQLLQGAVQSQQRQEAVRSGITGKEPPGVAEAIMAANAAQLNVVDDRQSPVYAGTNLPKQGTQPQPAKVDLQNCPHCNWPLERADPIEPTTGDRQQFFDSFLAGTAFVKTIELFGGAYKVTIRQLDAEEDEACYQQALRDFQAGDIQIMDLMERVMRYRTCLQVTKVTARGQETIELPENLAAWLRTDAEAQAAATESPIKKTPGLRRIRDLVYREVLPTEAIVRTVTFAVSNFNQLALKLESQVFNPDFLQRTA